MSIAVNSIEVQNTDGGLVVQIEMEEPINQAGEKWLRCFIPHEKVPQLIMDLQMCYSIGQSEEGKAYERKQHEQV